MTELKRLDLTKSMFTANGHEYHIETGFSIERYAEYQVLEKELGFATSFKGLHDGLVKMYGLMNGMKFVEASVLLNNLVKGVEKVSEREPTMLRMCALFMNRSDEDRRSINNDMIAAKIEDWKAEGYDMRDFFKVALNTLNGFIEIYERLTQATSAITERPEDQA